MSKVVRYALTITACALVALVGYLFVSAYNRTELTFDDIANASEEFTFESLEVNGKLYSGADVIVPLVKGEKLQIKVSFTKAENAGMVGPGVVKIRRPFRDGIETLQGAGFQDVTQKGKTFTISVSLTIPPETEPGKALLTFSGKRPYVELEALVQ